MSHWNYRIVKYRDGKKGYGLHEVYYDDDGKEISMTTEPCGFVCDVDENPDEIVVALKMALKDAKSKPVFDEPKEWTE